MKFVSPIWGGRNEKIKTENRVVMSDTFVRKYCLTSRKTINILKGVTAMFVVVGGG